MEELIVPEAGTVEVTSADVDIDLLKKQQQLSVEGGGRKRTVSKSKSTTSNNNNQKKDIETVVWPEFKIPVLDPELGRLYISDFSLTDIDHFIRNFRRDILRERNTDP